MIAHRDNSAAGEYAICIVKIAHWRGGDCCEATFGIHIDDRNGTAAAIGA